MRFLLLLLLLALSTWVRAEDLAPELAPLAAKYKADITALTDEQTAAVTKAKQQYVTALDEAAKTAAGSNNRKALEAIAHEKEALNFPEAAVEPYPDLPLSLQTMRKSYLAATERAAAAFAPRIQMLNDEYLRALKFLEVKAVTNPELAKQIAIEKANLTSHAPAASLSERLINTTWKWWGTETITFLPGGKARWSYSNHDSFTWKQTRSNKIEGTTEKGGVFSITFSPNFTTGKLLEDKKPERDVELLKRD